MKSAEQIAQARLDELDLAGHTLDSAIKSDWLNGRDIKRWIVEAIDADRAQRPRHNFAINAAFLREEIAEGALGDELGETVQTIVGASTDTQLSEAIDLVFNDNDHPIHAALDDLVRSAVVHAQALSGLQADSVLNR